MMGNILKYSSLGIIICGLLHCADMQIAGGGLDTETSGGTITGLIIHQDGIRSYNTQVSLIPCGYTPLSVSDTTVDSIRTTATDVQGTYLFKNIPQGLYNLEAVNSDSGSRLIHLGITVPNGESTQEYIDILRLPGRLITDLSYLDTTVTGYLYIPGTSIAQRVDIAQNRTVQIDSVPAGHLPPLQFVREDDSTVAIISDSIVLLPSQTLTITPFSVWQFSQQLVLNTTASGAAVPNNVYNFPVLIRLTPDNFNFTQAKANGADIRFAKSDNTPLPYEIEQWDSAAGHAEIWVLVDTVYGNSDAYAITMYWGAPAVSESNSEAVFDTAHGFQGVWHMAETGDTACTDATANGYNGVPTGMTVPAAVPGRIGTAQHFDGQSSGITMPNTASSRLNVVGDGQYSLSAWVYCDTLDTAYQSIVCKGDVQYALQITGRSDTTSVYREWEFFIYKNEIWEGTRVAAQSGVWKHIAGVRDGSLQYLYVDGVLATSEIKKRWLVPSIPLDTTYNVTIGFHPDYPRYFDGMIDEVRFQSNACSADWIKLTYMNQKPDDALVVFGKK